LDWVEVGTVDLGVEVSHLRVGRPVSLARASANALEGVDFAETAGSSQAAMEVARRAEGRQHWSVDLLAISLQVWVWPQANCRQIAEQQEELDREDRGAESRMEVALEMAEGVMQCVPVALTANSACPYQLLRPHYPPSTDQATKDPAHKDCKPSQSPNSHQVALAKARMQSDRPPKSQEAVQYTALES